jgi:hypothetical protein
MGGGSTPLFAVWILFFRGIDRTGCKIRTVHPTTKIHQLTTPAAKWKGLVIQRCSRLFANWTLRHIRGFRHTHGLTHYLFFGLFLGTGADLASADGAESDDLAALSWEAAGDAFAFSAGLEVSLDEDSLLAAAL